ncbi:MAG: ABC transporter permease subunit, partial [Gemmatimonadaceae bacterium]
MTSILLADARSARSLSGFTAGASASQTMRAVLRYAIRDMLRNRWMLAYGVGIAGIVEVLFRTTGSGSRALIGILNLVLIIIPLVSVVFGVMYWHSTREFNELLLAQPVKRRALWSGLYLGLIVPLAIAYVAGIAAPLLLHRAIDAQTLPILVAMLLAGVALTAVFGALAMLIGTCVDDRLKGIGLSLAVWIAMTALYDGVVLLVSTTFSDYSLERTMLAFTITNPVDLARTIIVLRTDTSALMGYTGAVIEKFLGSGVGSLAAVVGLGLWIAVPAWLALRAFERRD